MLLTRAPISPDVLTRQRGDTVPLPKERYTSDTLCFPLRFPVFQQDCFPIGLGSPAEVSQPCSGQGVREKEKQAVNKHAIPYRRGSLPDTNSADTDQTKSKLDRRDKLK